MMRVGSLFTGYGGLDLALSLLSDVRLAWVADNDPAASLILSHHVPNVPNLGDVTRVNWGQVESVEILTGGSPCQDVSSAGKLAGLTPGTRSNLWAIMREAIAELRPRLVVWENVRGVLNAPATSGVQPCPGCVGDGTGVSMRALGRVLGDLSVLGYDAQWTTIRASDVGAPHERARIFLVAFPTTDSPSLGREWSDRARDRRTGPPDGRRRHVPVLPSPVAAEAVKAPAQQDEATKRKTGTVWLTNVAISEARGLLLPTPVVNDMGGNKTLDWWDEWSADLAARLGNGNGHGPSLSIEVRDPDRWGRYAAAIERWENLTRPAPPATELGPTGPRLSAPFVEWMMGLPPGWVTGVEGVTRNAQLRLLGNGVVPAQAAAALDDLLDQVEP